MVFWLLPCAIQHDGCGASPTGLPLALTFAVFIGVYVATKLEPRAGAADGKLMVGLAAFAPLALGIGALLEVLAFAVLRLRGQRDVAIPRALWLYVGCLLSVLAGSRPTVAT